MFFDWPKVGPPNQTNQKNNSAETSGTKRGKPSRGPGGSPPILVGEPHWLPGHAGEQLTTMSFFHAPNCINFTRICVSIWTPFSILSFVVIWHLLISFWLRFSTEFGSNFYTFSCILMLWNSTYRTVKTCKFEYPYSVLAWFCFSLLAQFDVVSFLCW